MSAERPVHQSPVSCPRRLLQLGTYARRREADKGWALYQALLGEPGAPAPNLFTYAAVLNALSKASHPPYDLPPEAAARAEGVVAHLRAAGLRPNLVVVHTLMNCQAKAAQPEAALRTLRQMQVGTYLCVCAWSGVGGWVHGVGGV